MRAVNLVEQRRPESADDREEQHSVRGTSTANVESLRFAFERTEAHTESRQEEYTSKDRSDDTALDKLTFTLMQGVKSKPMM